MSVHSILLLSPVIPSTGNTTTITRIQSHFDKHNMKSKVCSVTELSDVNDNMCKVKKLNQVIKQTNSSGVLLLHAFKSGIYTVCSCAENCRPCVKYGVIFGGTDLNEDIKDFGKKSTIYQCLLNASFSVAFTQHLKETAKSLCPQAYVILCTQAVDYDLFCQQRLPRNIMDHNANLSPQHPFVIVLPCSLRPVKDPLFVVEDFLKWTVSSHSRLDVRLLILGNVADKPFFAEMKGQLRSLISKYVFPDVSSHKVEAEWELKKCENSKCPIVSWLKDSGGSKIVLHSSLERQNFIELMKQGCFYALLNTSLSEGLASSLLEAMSLGIPVIARDIPGNRAVIKDGVTGLLFESPEHFLLKIQKLLSDHRLYEYLVGQARDEVISHHCPDKEADIYLSLARKHLRI